MNEEIESLEWILKYGEEQGADEVEVYYVHSKGLRVEVNLGQVSSCHFSDEQGVGIRVVVKGAMGFSFSNNLEKEKVKEAVVRAVKAARASKPDKKWRGLPLPGKPASVSDIFDRKVCNVTEEELVDVAKIMVDAATEYSNNVMAYWGVAVSGVEEVVILNSHGVDVDAKGTTMGCALGTVAKEGDAVSPECNEFDFQRRRKIRPEKVGREAARLAVESLKRVEVEQGRHTVVLAHPALHALMGYTFLHAVSGDNIARERSPYTGKLGEQVASSLLHVEDDGTLKGGLNTFPFDDEGVPSQKKKVIEKGVLKGFLFDNYWAGVMGTDSTGNAKRAGYASTPSIAATNVIIKKGNYDFEKIIEDMSNGLIIWDLQGAHSSNPVSGEVSAVATPCWAVKRGEVIGAVRGAMIAENFYDMLKRVDCVGSDVRQYSFLFSPSLRFTEVKMVTTC